MTMPAVPPYSSATIARWMPSRRMSVSAARIGRVHGSIRMSRASSPTRTDRPAMLGVEQVAHVHEADDVVGGAADHRVARVRLRQRLPRRLVDRRRGVEEVDLGARHHHLADLPVAGLEDVLEDPALLLAERLVRADQLAQLLVGDLLALGVRVAAEQPDDDVGRRPTAARSPAGTAGEIRSIDRAERQRERSRPAAARAAWGPARRAPATGRR